MPIEFDNEYNRSTAAPQFQANAPKPNSWGLTNFLIRLGLAKSQKGAEVLIFIAILLMFAIAGYLVFSKNNVSAPGNLRTHNYVGPQ
jgi:hypothetical protein